MNIKGEIVMPHVYVLTFDTQYELCMSFVRMQEFYESQKFRGKYFTLEEFVDYWSTEFGHGSFDYPARWNGFNLPSKVIEDWKDLFGAEYQDVRRREWAIINCIEELRIKENNPEKYYVMGIHANSSEKYRQEVIDHECAHALYYLNPVYKKACNKLIDKSAKSTIGKASKKLTKMGYGKNVIKDEIQAYFSTEETKSLLADLSGKKAFADNFNKYREKWVGK